MTKRAFAIAAILTTAIALPAMAQTTSGNEKSAQGAQTEAKVLPIETIVVTAFADPSFPQDCAGEACSAMFSQYAYGFVNGKWQSVDHLTHADFPFVKLTAADMEQQYPGA